MTMKNLLTISFLVMCVMTWSVSGAQGNSSEKFLDFTVTEKHLEAEKFDTPFRDDPYFKIDSIKVTEIPVTASELYNLQDQAQGSDKEEFSNKNLGQIIMSIDKLIALGTKIWEIVKKGKPVTNLSFAKPVSVLPNGETPQTAFNQMTGWSAPTARKYKVEYTNLLGMNVISFDYTVYFQHSGQYQDKGDYITGLTVRASNIAVSWGFEFNASSELETISNRGSRDNPMAAATIRINYQASSVLRDIQSSQSFHVSGNGEIVNF